MSRSILLIRCPDQPGIISRYASLLYDLGGNLLRTDQYTTEPDHARFFMRIEFEHDGGPERRDMLRSAVGPLTDSLGGVIQLHDADAPCSSSNSAASCSARVSLVTGT